MAERGHEVVIIDLPRFGPVDPAGVLHPTTEVEFHDLVETDGWERCLEGVDVVVHCAANHQVNELHGNPIRGLDVNVGVTRRLLESCEMLGVRRFVYLSSAKVYGKADHASEETDLVMPIESYGLAKVVGEGYCDHFRRKGAFETTSLRPFSVYGPRQPVNTGYVGALLGTLQASNQLVLPGQRTFTRDFVHIDTVVETVVAAIAAEGALPPLINVGSGVRTSLSDLVGVFETVTGRRLDVTFVEPRPGTLRSTLSNPALMNEFASPKPIQLERGLAETVAAYVDES